MAHDDLLTEFIDIYMSSLKNLEKLISQPTSEFGISFEQWLIMSAVAKNTSEKPLTMTEIAATRGVTKGAVARQLKPLFEREYLQQIHDTADRRRVLLVLTQTGQEVESMITLRVNQRFNGWLEIYGHDEGLDLLNTFQRLDDLIVKPELKKKKH
ncbi:MULTISPECIES: MarR family winged helix-turn-helix transcriptional regulator [Leuconostoc]|uniref:Transcription regulator (Putative) n=2 Tax=Leuconostoc kimchii TaxID=136609 RepID=D5T4E1_LEUKI|nr:MULTISPECIES: MarR family transcriptional regulator [Leuconostoc]ADG41079.1 transcription regulator (putative) [Leuconostoc kimchii IMSNU 11154]AEJ30949.1 transcription regulator (putative) [Leuconostoc sp. C2]QBR48046.1 MarR family transcriptional regulator [Leuconostoc kimchii]